MKTQNANFADYEHVEFFGTALQDFPSYTGRTTVSALKAMKWRKTKTEDGCRITAQDENGKYTFHVFEGGNRGHHTLVSLYLEGTDKDCNHGYYEISVAPSMEDFERPNPRQHGMFLCYQSCEGGDWLKDWNLHGDHDKCDLAYWGIGKTLAWVEYITGKKLA